MGAVVHPTVLMGNDPPPPPLGVPLVHNSTDNLQKSIPGEKIPDHPPSAVTSQSLIALCPGSSLRPEVSSYASTSATRKKTNVYCVAACCELGSLGMRWAQSRVPTGAYSEVENTGKLGGAYMRWGVGGVWEATCEERSPALLPTCSDGHHPIVAVGVGCVLNSVYKNTSFLI